MNKRTKNTLRKKQITLDLVNTILNESKQELTINCNDTLESNSKNYNHPNNLLNESKQELTIKCNNTLERRYE